MSKNIYDQYWSKSSKYDVDCNAGVLLEVSDECECPTSKSVSVCTVLDNVYKDKNTSYLSYKKVLPENHHSPIRKLHEQNQKWDQVNVIPRIKVPSVVTHSKCPSQDCIGDTQNISKQNFSTYQGECVPFKTLQK